MALRVPGQRPLVLTSLLRLRLPCRPHRQRPSALPEWSPSDAPVLGLLPERGFCLSLSGRIYNAHELPLLEPSRA